VEQQLRRLHDKRVDHKRAPGKNGIAEPAPAEGDDGFVDSGDAGDAGED
jgi:hypothetical protein